MPRQVLDFPEKVADVIVDGVTRSDLNLIIPAHLVDHPTRTVTIMIKNRTDVDVYVKSNDYQDNQAMRITAKEYEAFEFTPIYTSVTMQIWSIAAPTNGESVEIVREG